VYLSNVQDEAEAEDGKYTISVSVISPRKVGDGVGAYMVYKVVTKVCCRSIFRSSPGRCPNRLTEVRCVRPYVHTSICLSTNSFLISI